MTVAGQEEVKSCLEKAIGFAKQETENVKMKSAEELF